MPLKYTKTVILITLLILLAAHVQGQVAPGRITVSSTPSGATACIDIANCDVTPATFSVDGNAWHTIAVTGTGYLPWTSTVYVISDQTSVVNAILVQNLSTTGVQVYVTPGGATVCIDYSQCTLNVGSPSGTGSTQFTGMNAGYHTITASLSGYQDYSTPVYVNMGSFTTVTISLVPSGVTTTPTPAPVFPSAGLVRVYVDQLGSTICIDNGDCRDNVGGSSGPGTGTALFSGVKPGITHTITVTEDGFLPYSTQVSVIQDLESTVDVHLVPVTTPTTSPTPTPTPTPSPTVPVTSERTTVIPQSTRAGLDPVPVLGALGLCGAIAFVRKNCK